MIILTYRFRKAPFSRCFASTRKLAFCKSYGYREYSKSSVSVDARPNRSDKAVYLNFFGVVPQFILRPDEFLLVLR